jgi:5-formyltetrahydrofolate cyclo-ligase
VTFAKRAKHLVRERIWGLLEREGAALPPGAQGRIRNFVGADRAVGQLATLPAWRDAQVIKATRTKPSVPSGKGVGGRQAALHGGAAAG